jgi:hypothetical protein
MVPEQRRIAKKYSGLSLFDIETLLLSRIHEHRLVPLLILLVQYKEAGEPGQGKGSLPFTCDILTGSITGTLLTSLRRTSWANVADGDAAS